MILGADIIVAVNLVKLYFTILANAISHVCLVVNLNVDHSTACGLKDEKQSLHFRRFDFSIFYSGVEPLFCQSHPKFIISAIFVRMNKANQISRAEHNLKQVAGCIILAL